MRRISRRSFVLVAAAGLASSACRPGAPAPLPATRPAATPTVAPPPTPTATPRRTARVVRTRCPGVWQSGNLDPAALGRMLDTSLARLTGLDDPASAWASLFRADERVAIKVNAILTGSTHLPLVMAVVERLQGVGIAPEQITIYDRSTAELWRSGFPVNVDKPGVRCLGTDGRFEGGWEVDGTGIRLSEHVLGCDALINMPILKVAGTPGAGISFALKNHYGSFDVPSRFHDSRFIPGLSRLNALPPISERTRLTIGDVLSMDTQPDSLGYPVVGGYQAILAAFDPVALDAVGMGMAAETLAVEGGSRAMVTVQASRWLEAAQELGLGVGDPEAVDVVDVET